MDTETKRIFLFFFSLALGIIFVFSGYFWKMNLIITDFFKSFISERYVELAILFGILSVLFITILFILTPIPGFSTPLFLKIAYELVFGYYKDSNVFKIGISFKPVISILCVICAFYYLYKQWKMDFKEIKKLNDKDLVKFI